MYFLFNDFEMMFKYKLSKAMFVGGLLFCFHSQASVEVGGGMNSLTAGRIRPAAEISILTGDSAISWTSAGVRNSYYYMAAHQISYFKTWNSGTLWGGTINSGFGAGGAYSVRSFKDEGSSVEEKTSDYILGPAIRMNWSYGFLYLNLSCTFGIRDLWQHLTGLTFQDVETISLGVRF